MNGLVSAMSHPVPQWNRVLLIDSLLLIVLSLYVLAGRDQVPFHGDESIQLAMSRDYYYVVQSRTLAPLAYEPNAPDMATRLDHHLRVVNGTLNQLTIGLAWDAAGLTVHDLNLPWIWGAPDEWNWNVATHRLPDRWLLHVARTPSALFTALSVPLVLLLARRAMRSPLAGWIAALTYATHPAVLLNGRRAMQEGALLFWSLLVVLAGIELAARRRAQRRARHTERATVRPGWHHTPTAGALLTGILGGLALTSKHTALLTIVAVFTGISYAPGARRIAWRDGVVAASAMLLVFLAFNPAWWAQPLAMPRYVVRERSALLADQRAGADTYDNLLERLGGLADQAWFAGAQYAEVPGWQDHIRDEIAAYETGGLAGRAGGWAWGMPLLALNAAGLVALGRRWRSPAARLLLVWIGLVAVSLLLTIPFPWQRYYLPLAPGVAVLTGCGAAWLTRAAPARVAPLRRKFRILPRLR